MKRFKVPVWCFALLTAGVSIFSFVSNSRAATETPDYALIRADHKFEIRDYPTLAVASTPVNGEDMNGGFGKLFRFITGENEGAAKIAMTAPVLIDSAEDHKTMSFIMPKDAVEKGVPKPAGESVKLTTIEAARFAVLRFEGGRTTKNEQSAIAKLKGWLDEQKIVSKGDPLFAYYDPPWTPVFLRRNEVMVRIAKYTE